MNVHTLLTMEGDLRKCCKHSPKSDQVPNLMERFGKWLTPFLAAFCPHHNPKPIYFTEWLRSWHHRWITACNSSLFKASDRPGEYQSPSRSNHQHRSTMPMATATLRHAPISSKTTPRTPLTPLRHYVASRYPDQYKPTCDYIVKDRVILRVKRFIGQIVDERPIGELPENFDVVRVFTDDFDGLVIGEREPIERMRHLESMYWSVCNQINVLFTVPAAPSFPTSGMGRGTA